MLTATKGNHNDQAHHFHARRRHRAQFRYDQLCRAEAGPESEGSGADLLQARDRRKLILTHTDQPNNKPTEHPRTTTMTKLISTLAVVITLITTSAAGAQTRQRQELVNRPAPNVTIPVSGAEWWQNKGNSEDMGYTSRGR